MSFNWGVQGPSQHYPLPLGVSQTSLKYNLLTFSPDSSKKSWARWQPWRGLMAFNFYDFFISVACVMLFDSKLLVGKRTLKNVSFASLSVSSKWSKAWRSRIAEWGSKNLEDTPSVLQPVLTALLAEISWSYLEISLYLKLLSRADVHTSSYCRVTCEVGLSGLTNQNVSSTICFLKLLHGLTVECHLPLKIRSETGPSLQL